jgi:hypothetical protein
MLCHLLSLASLYSRENISSIIKMSMALGRLATSRRGRNVTTKPTWKEKIEPECLKYLEMHRQASAKAAKPEREFGDVVEWLRCFSANLELFPSPQKTDEPETIVVTLDRKFVDLLRSLDAFDDTLKEGENAVPLGYARMLEIAQPIALHLEDARMRAAACCGLGFFCVMIEPVIRDLQLAQFGAEPLDSPKMRSLVALILEFLAKFVRGRWELPKGRTNLELIAIVNVINKHQIVRLTARELRAAVAHAGLFVPTEETWRIWLHRAKKNGLVSEPAVHKTLPTEVEIPINSEGSFDLNSLDPATRRRVRRALRAYVSTPSGQGN